MSEFHDDYPSYETMALHDEDHGKKIRKKIIFVFLLLLVVTIVEIYVGMKAEDWGLSSLFLKVFFIGFTIIKAFYIVYSFMHLGDEVKWTKWLIIAPFSGFILYLIFMMTIGEGNYAKEQRFDLPRESSAQQHGTTPDKGEPGKGGQGHK